MTGTSCDGLDASCVAFDGDPSAAGNADWNASISYPPSLRTRILDIQRAGARISIRDLLGLEASLSDWYATSLKKIIGKKTSDAPDLIALHGQTVAHHPDLRSTLQLGNAARVAEATGVSVASRFRDGDLAAGGQGAPLLPLFHLHIAHSIGSAVSIHNIGGISNLTYVEPDGTALAFDTGPGNIWIDEAARIATRGRLAMDRDGRLGKSGIADMKAVEHALKHPFFKKRPPKSTGRDDFPFSILARATRAKGADLVATSTEVTVESIARAYSKWLMKKPLKEILVCGGGAKNRHLMERLSERLNPVAVRSISELGWDPGMIEAQGFALFGFRSLLGASLGGKWTGAKRFGPPGWITPGSNWPALLQKVVAVQSPS